MKIGDTVDLYDPKVVKTDHDAEHLGDVYMALDQRKRAYEFYQEAVRLDHREDEQPRLLEKLEKLRLEIDGQ